MLYTFHSAFKICFASHDWFTHFFLLFCFQIKNTENEIEELADLAGRFEDFYRIKTTDQNRLFFLYIFTLHQYKQNVIPNRNKNKYKHKSNYNHKQVEGSIVPENSKLKG